MIWDVHPGSGSLIQIFFQSQILDPDRGSGSRIQGSKNHRIPDPGSGSATLLTTRLDLIHHFPNVYYLYKEKSKTNIFFPS
jgi:hypothetical protein